MYSTLVTHLTSPTIVDVFHSSYAFEVAQNDVFHSSYAFEVAHNDVFHSSYAFEVAHNNVFLSTYSPFRNDVPPIFQH